MMSLTCLQNQLLPLSQIFGTFGSWQKVPSARVFTKSKNSDPSESNGVHADSPTPVSNVFAALSYHDVNHLLEQISPVYRQCRARPASFSQSHVSANTFLENKQGYRENVCYHSLILPFQIRTFKTYRSGDVNIQNTSVTERLRSKFQGGDVKRLALGNVHDMTARDIKALLGSEKLAPEEQARLKIAFAEGYLAADPKKNPSRAMRALKVTQYILSVLIFAAILFTFMGTFGGSSVFRVSVGNGSEVAPEEINVTFDDVKGVEEAKQELKEIVEFLKNPEKFSTLGGKLPKGVLLVGPPGTGKTLLARAVAGEAGVPYFHAAGPEFDEILVGQGARRVRDLFKAAKMRAPCVIFIDEIDSVGAKRSSSVLHPYANQTINQLLAEMDGFHQNEGVIVLGATNRRDDLDKALLRPGRFDVEVQVPVPDFAGRKEILQHYLSKVKLADDVDVELLARGTTGFTGADIENLVNQAAVRGAIDGVPAVTTKYLEQARDKVLMGPERKSRIPDEEANLITAYHEGGHTIVAHYTQDAHPLHKVTIIPRGPSLGHTAYIPEKERYHVTRSQLLAMMDVAMGGRAAEELIFGHEKITSGASSDLKQATSIAMHMVKEWGMSEKVGFRTIEQSSGSLVVVNDLSPQTSELIDSEIKRILQESYDRAKAILKEHKEEHKMLAEALMKYETLDADDVKSILTSKKDY
ncbi:hypothetical protein OUZ56_009288 [Daphnia magna]|nr:hypothetical protein OUZ56_009288 [Daphnia magna]